MEVSSATEVLAVVSACVIVWSLLAARLERLNITAPIAFVLLALVVTHGPTAFIHLSLGSSTIRMLAEVALAVILFVDASRVNARRLLADVGIPLRLLGIGLPLTIGAGTVVAAALFGENGLWVAALLAAIVAPTDAALSAPLMGDARIPSGVRRVLNVESGLNDGIATPFVNLFLAGAVAAESARVAHGQLSSAVLHLLGGAGLGVAVGVGGAACFAASRKANWSDPGFRPLMVLALGLFAYAAADLAHTNGFVAAFVAGMAFGTVQPVDDELLGFAEEGGTLLSLLVWFIFGAVMLVPGLKEADWRDLVFALAALTVVRMIPVAISLLGTGLSGATVGLIGWFGPRGLASVVFGLLAVDTLDPAQARVVLPAVTVTVALSVVAHGVSASPVAEWYARRTAGLSTARPEHRALPTVPVRTLRPGRVFGVPPEP